MTAYVIIADKQQSPLIWPIQSKQVLDQSYAFMRNAKISHEVSPLNTAVTKDEK